MMRGLCGHIVNASQQVSVEQMLGSKRMCSLGGKSAELWQITFDRKLERYYAMANLR